MLAVAILACFDGSAKRKGKKAKQAEAAKVDTCSVDTFSYAIGMANTLGLKAYLAQRMNVDTAYMANFLEGFNATLSMDERKRLEAYAAGLVSRHAADIVHCARREGSHVHNVPNGQHGAYPRRVFHPCGKHQRITQSFGRSGIKLHSGHA